MIYHSLFLRTRDLFFINSLTKKYKVRSCWSIWGRDLYDDYEAAKNSVGLHKIKALYNESLRRKLISRMCGFITTGDYDALKERYKIDNNAFVRGAQYTYTLLPSIQSKTTS